MPWSLLTLYVKTVFCLHNFALVSPSQEPEKSRTPHERRISDDFSSLSKKPITAPKIPIHHGSNPPRRWFSCSNRSADFTIAQPIAHLGDASGHTPCPFGPNAGAYGEFESNPSFVATSACTTSARSQFDDQNLKSKPFEKILSAAPCSAPRCDTPCPTTGQNQHAGSPGRCTA